MPATNLAIESASDVVSADMRQAVDSLVASIAERLTHAGLTLPASDTEALAEAVLNDALRLSLAWLEPDAARR